MPGRFKGEARDEWHRLQKKRLLNSAGLGGLLLHSFARRALEPEEAGVLNGNSDVSGKRLKHLELIVREGVRLVMVNQKNADDLTGGFEGDANFRARGWFADNIVGVLADVRGVAHLARSCHMTDHALSANLQPVSLAVLRAATHSM